MVPADGGLQKPVPLKALGRYRHEAVAFDPRSGILYLTENRNDGLLYRFVPAEPRNFHAGRLQALVIAGRPSADLRNSITGVAQWSQWSLNPEDPLST
jgi:uncharacterized protein